MDIVYINGYGFPIWRGGPMFYANSIGLDKVLEKINKFAEKDEDFWKPADLLVALANDGGKFADAPTDNLKKEKLAFKQEVKY
jgi:3-hydroxyacyl-CoA dehydrogenase